MSSSRSSATTSRTAATPGCRPSGSSSTSWITHTLAQKYNGKTAPRLVLFSPIAHEDLRNPDLPDGRENNARLELYTLAMAQVAAARGVRFVDLFAPTKALYAAAKTPLTINGVHLNEEGNRRLAEIIDRELFGAPPRAYPRAYLTALQRAVADKSFHWFNRYRTTDGFATFGDRAFLTFIRNNPRNVNPNAVKNKEDVLPTNYEVLQREVEVLDHLTMNRDRQIWRDRARPRPESRRAEGRRLRHAAVHRRRHQRAGQGPGGAHIYARRRAGHLADEGRARAEGRAVRLGEGVPRAGQPGADGLRHARPALGRGLEELSALAAQDADGRQAADPRGHQRRRQGRQAHGLRRRPAQPDRLRVLERRRDPRRRRPTSSSSRTPTATTSTTRSRSSSAASTRPTRTTR